MAAKHIVKCAICNKQFDANAVPYVKINSRRYAHTACSLSEGERKLKEEQDKLALEQYIMKLFNITALDARIRKQINQYIADYEYTYSGMHKALVYFFEVKGNSIEKANGGIGIVPYVYKQAYEYYYALWLAQQKNENKIVEEYVPVVKEVHIPRPQRKIKQRKLFAFLDEEE